MRNEIHNAKVQESRGVSFDADILVLSCLANSFFFFFLRMFARFTSH